MYTIYSTDPMVRVPADEIIEKPTVVHVGEITEETPPKFASEMRKAVNSGQSIVPVIINSGGGYVDSLAAMVETIESCPIPVATMTTGYAFSCGAFLLACGTKGMRYASKYSRIMIHELREEQEEGSSTQSSDLISEAKEMHRMNKMWLEKIATTCGKRKDHFLDILKKHGTSDIYLTPRQAKTHGIIDTVGIPTLHIAINVSMSLK
jgi:ATP-dependent Clp protease protease subunit